MLCDCDVLGEDDALFLFGSLRSGFEVEGNNTGKSGLNGLERGSGKGFDELDPNSSSAGRSYYQFSLTLIIDSTKKKTTLFASSMIDY